MRAHLLAALAALIAAPPLIAAGPAADVAADRQVAPPAPPPADALAVAPAAGAIAGGDLGTLSMPALALPAPRQLSVGLGLDYFRGGNFLLPGATVQRSAMSLGLAYAPLPWLEAYGALAFSAANRFGPSTHQTLSSLGDADLGAKLVLPPQGPLSAGALLELDIPSGVGGISLKGTGGRAAALADLAGQLGPVPLVGTLVAGYVLDNGGRLFDTIATFPAYALALSNYDRVQGELSLQAPLRYAAPAVELQVEAPVARLEPFPAGPHPARTRLLLGAASIRTGVPGLIASAGLCFSLTRTGQVDATTLPMPGFAPDSPWRALVTVAYSFEPKLPERRAPVWHNQPEVQPPPPRAVPQTRAPLLGQAVGTGLAPRAQPAVAAPPIAEGKGRISVLVVDSHTQQPLPNAWVSALELSDLGTTTGADGRASLDAPPGGLTLAVAHDGYDPYSDSVRAEEGKESELTIALQPQLMDATVKGRIVGEDGQPLRASIELQPLLGAGPLSTGSEPPIFEGSFSLSLPHGSFNLVARAPGYQAAPLRVSVLPGEVASREVQLRRVPGEDLARAAPSRVEFTPRLSFIAGTAQLQPASIAALADLERVLENAGPVTVGVRVDPSELASGEDELTALLLAEQRAQAVVEALVIRGLPRSQLQAHGFGIAKEGQPLLEIKRGRIGGKPSL